jgi:hypothetical protein
VSGRRHGADLPVLVELLDLFVALGCSLRDALRLEVSSASLSELLPDDIGLLEQFGALAGASLTTVGEPLDLVCLVAVKPHREL